MLPPPYPIRGTFPGGEDAALSFAILFTKRLPHQPNDFARFGVTVGLQFGIDQVITNSDLEFATI